MTGPPARPQRAGGDEEPVRALGIAIGDCRQHRFAVGRGPDLVKPIHHDQPLYAWRGRTDEHRVGKGGILPRSTEGA